MNRNEIKNILPHRNSMLLLDEAVRKSDGIAEGIYTVRGDEWFLDGHFPGNPIVPGVILCEMMAQTTCVLLGENPALEGKTPYFTGLDRVKFRSPVKPGDRIIFRCELTRVKSPFYFAKGYGKVGETVCVTADFSFALSDK